MPATIGLFGGDPEESPVTYTILTTPKHGTLTGTPPKLTYVSTGYIGLDSFTFKVNDGELDSPPVTITLNVISSSLAQFTITGVAGAGWFDQAERELCREPGRKPDLHRYT